MKYIFYLLFSITLIACSDIGESPSVDCLGTVDIENAEYCTGETPEGKFCEPRYVGKYALTDHSRNQLPFYCESIGASLDFVNSFGEVQSFILEEKGFFETNGFLSQGPCPDDPTKTLLDCIDYESAFVRLRSDKHHIQIELLSQPDREDSSLGNVGDFLRIHREEVAGFFVQEWMHVTDKRTLSYDTYPCTKVYDAINLNGTTFFNVITFDQDQDCAHYTYYLNKEFGLVGFSRSDDMLWSLD